MRRRVMHGRKMKVKSAVIICASLFVSYLIVRPVIQRAASYSSRSLAAKAGWLDSNPNCTPLRNIAYLKTHKTGSSAIQNLLFRYGLNHNLTMAVPDIGNYFGRGIPFRRNFIVPQFNGMGSINIFAIHTKWNHEEVKSVMPENTIFITSVRKPEDLFESLFTYSLMGVNDDVTLDEYVRKVSENGERFTGVLGYNQMNYDSGLTQEEINNISAVHNNIVQMDRQFDLVMVAERMEESLILLKHLLCWDLEDIVVLKINARMNKFKKTISRETSNLLGKKQLPDELLYAHFSRKFDKLVNEFGRKKMDEEIRKLRELTKKFMKNCNITEVKQSQLLGPNKPWSPMVKGYQGNMGNLTCRSLLWTENAMIEHVRRKQQSMTLLAMKRRLKMPLGAVAIGGGGLPNLQALIKPNEKLRDYKDIG